jgi:hypothetical protein
MTANTSEWQKNIAVLCDLLQPPIAIAGTFTATATNPSVGTDGAAIPTSSTLVGASDGTNLQPLQVDGSGNLKIVGSITASNPSVSTDGSAIPASSTLIGASDGTLLQQLLVESATNRNLRISLYSGANEATISGGALTVAGTVTANAGTGNHTVVQATGSNLHAVLDASSAVIGHVIADASTAVIGHVIADTGSTTAVTSLPALPTGANTIGNVGLVTGAATIGAVTQASGPWTSNLTQINSAAIGVGNPFLTNDIVRAYTQSAQGFAATSDKITSSVAQNAGVFLFNPNTAKTCVITAIRVYNTAASAQPQLRTITTAPTTGYTAITPINRVIGNAATSLMTSGYNANVGSITGTAIDTLNSSTNTTLEFCQNNKVYILPPSSNQGLLVWFAEGGTGSFGVTFEYVEY